MSRRSPASPVAARANPTSSIFLEQRAEMRGRLVHAAMQGMLRHGGALLAGFGTSTPIDVTMDVVRFESFVGRESESE